MRCATTQRWWKTCPPPRVPENFRFRFFSRERRHFRRPNGDPVFNAFSQAPKFLNGLNVGFSDDVQELFLFRANTRPMPKCQSGSSANRRRGTGLRSGWLPPILASCHALSFSTSAFRALLISSGFEMSPVKFCACSRSSSSMLTVILIFPCSWLSPGRYNTHTGTYIKSVRKPVPRLPSAAFSGGVPGEAS